MTGAKLSLREVADSWQLRPRFALELRCISHARNNCSSKNIRVKVFLVNHQCELKKPAAEIGRGEERVEGQGQ